MTRKTLIAALPLCLLALSFFSLAQGPEDGEMQLAQRPEEREIEIEIGEEEPHPAREILDSGIGYYKEKQYDQAVAEYQKVLSDFPETDYAAEAQFRIANVYHWGTRQPEKALNAYEKVMDSYPDSQFAVRSLVRIGSIYHWELEERDPQKAIEYYQRMLSKAPDHKYAPEALYWMGEAYRWSIKDADKALEIYQSVVDRYPQSDRALKAQLRIADIYRKRQWDDPRAKEIYERIVSEQPEGPIVEEARYYLGVYYLFKRDYESALRELKAAVNYSTNHVECLYWAGHRIGKMYGCHGCSPPAGVRREELEQFLKAHRENFPASCQRIMTERPGTHHARLAQYFLGKFYFDESDYNKAVEILSKVPNMTSIDDYYYRARSYIAWSYAIKGRYEDAIREYKNMLEYATSKPAVLLNISITYEEARDFANAKAYYNKVIQLYPESPHADEARKRSKILERLRY